MKRKGCIDLVAMSVVLLLLASCASSHQRTAIEQAKLVYADTSIAYQAAVTSILDLRAQHKVSDAQFAQVVKAAGVVQMTAPAVRDAIRLWEATGTKPGNFDNVLREILIAAETVEKVLAEVKP